MIYVDPVRGSVAFVPAIGSSVSSVNGRTGAVVLTKADVGLPLVDNTSDANKPISIAAQTALNSKADLVGGVIPTAQIPAIAITTKLASVGSQAAMLALSGQEGDWTIRTDLGTTWVITGADPTQLSNWTALSYPTAPVLSVNGQTGVVVLSASDVGAQPHDSDLDAIAALTTNSFGRGFLPLTDESAARTYIGAGVGSVTSVAASGGTTGFNFVGGPITGSGTITLGGQLSYASDVVDYILALNSEGISLYSSINNSGGGTYARKASSWLANTTWHSGIDLTPIAVYNSVDTRIGVTLISPRHFIMSTIGQLANGTTIRFVKSDNTVVSRTVSNSVNIAGSDIAVGLLDSDVPSGIGFCKVLPASIESTQLGRALGYVTTDDQKVYAADLYSISASTGLISVKQSVYSDRSRFWKSIGYPATGHEGSPYFFVLDKSLVLVGPLNEDKDTIWSIAFRHAAINAAMTTLGGGYQLTDYAPTVIPPRVPTPTGIPIGVVARDSANVASVDVGLRTLNDTAGNVILSWGETPNRVTLPDTAGILIGSNEVLVGDALTDFVAAFGFARNADNLSELSDFAAARTNLGATTVGTNLFTVANPSAVRYIRIDANNGITLRTAAQQLGDLGGEPALGNPGTNGYLLSSTAVGVRSWVAPPSGGDASTNTSTSVDSELALFSGTLGKTLKRATGSGIVKLASGVLGFGATTSDLTEGSNLYYTDARVRLNRLDQMAVPTANVSMGSNRITNVTDPSGAQDAATKNYVDLAIAGFRKTSVRIATTANDTLSGLAARDGITPVAGDRVLVKSQTTTADNGIYAAAAGAWARASDVDSAAEFDGLLVFVHDGTANAGTIWISTSDVTTLGTDAVTFTQFNKATDLVAGAALTASGLTWDVAVDGSTIEVSGDALRVKDAGITLAKMANLAANSIIGNNTGSAATPIALTAAQVKTLLSLNNVENTALSTWAGTSSITTLGTITTGTWTATVLDPQYGGTGVNNSGKSITLANNFVTSGNFSLTLTQTGTTNVTLPTSGTLAALGGTNTWTGANVISTAGAASTPALKISGVPFAGTGTTSFPLVYINDANATASTTLSTNGTYFGINGDGSQDLMNVLRDGTSKFKIDSNGAITAGEWSSGSGTFFNFGAGIKAAWSGRASMQSTADGIIAIQNNAQTGFTRLDFGLTTNSGSAIGWDAVNGFTFQSAAGTATWNDASTANSGTVADRYLLGFSAPTLSSTGTAVTYTRASTLYIGGAPTAGTNVTITTPFAIYVAAGNIFLGGTIELGNASDTTIARAAAGQISVEGVNVPTISSTDTLTNKRVTKRTGTTTSSATPTINTDNVDFYSITALAVDITSMTTNLSGTPTEGQTLWIAFTGTAARAIAWGTSFESSTVTLPTTTVGTARLDVGCVWNTVTSKWRCVAVA